MIGHYNGMNRFQPVGAALPPRRESTVEAAHVAQPSRNVTIDVEGIVPQKAQDRFYELIEREQIPTDVRNTLAGALTGDLQRQQLLFQAMLDTWPMLQKCVEEVADSVASFHWKVEPNKDRDGEATEAAKNKADLVKRGITSTRPHAACNENNFKDAIKDIARGYYMGHQVIETLWTRKDGEIVPRAFKTLPTRFYSYPIITEENDRLMLCRDGRYSGVGALEDFPPHHFLIAIKRGHTGHPTIAAPLRALAGYWIAAVYGLKYFLKFAQLFGVPFRWAEYADPTSKTDVCTMLANIGNGGWAAFPKDTKMNVIDAAKGGQSLPQKDLIEMADEQCQMFILGQTLTSNVGDSGSRALGDVHESVRGDKVKSVSDFVGGILSNQLACSIVALNYGEDSEVPDICADIPVHKDEKGMAERDKMLREAFPDMEWSEKQVRDRHGINKPEDEDDTFHALPHGAGGESRTGDRDVKPHETRERVESSRQDERITVNELTESVLEGLTGVSVEWLEPIKPAFQRLAALAMSETVTDEDFLAAYDKAVNELPELFGKLDTQSLQEAFTNAIGSGLFAGSADRYTEG